MTKEEFEKLDKDYEVCLCVGVTIGEIQTAIKNGCNTLEAIMDETEAGTRCEQCSSRDIDEDGEKELHVDEVLKFSK